MGHECQYGHSLRRVSAIVIADTRYMDTYNAGCKRCGCLRHVLLNSWKVTFLSRSLSAVSGGRRGHNIHVWIPPVEHAIQFLVSHILIKALTHKSLHLFIKITISINHFDELLNLVNNGRFYRKSLILSIRIRILNRPHPCQFLHCHPRHISRMQIFVVAAIEWEVKLICNVYVQCVCNVYVQCVQWVCISHGLSHTWLLMEQ